MKCTHELRTDMGCLNVIRRFISAIGYDYITNDIIKKVVEVVPNV